jgi:hypothetical protein
MAFHNNILLIITLEESYKEKLHFLVQLTCPVSSIKKKRATLQLNDLQVKHPLVEEEVTIIL